MKYLISWGYIKPKNIINILFYLNNLINIILSIFLGYVFSLENTLVETVRYTSEPTVITTNNYFHWSIFSSIIFIILLIFNKLLLECLYNIIMYYYKSNNT